jgi:hypothetical protein
MAGSCKNRFYRRSAHGGSLPFNEWSGCYTIPRIAESRNVFTFPLKLQFFPVGDKWSSGLTLNNVKKPITFPFRPFIRVLTVGLTNIADLNFKSLAGCPNLSLSRGIIALVRQRSES